MTKEEQAFLDVLEADPLDITTRRVYSDWLLEHGRDDESEFHREWTIECRNSEDWIRGFAYELGISFTMLMQEARAYQETGHWLCLGDETPDRVFSDTKAFWEHYQRMSGRYVPEEKHQRFIRCAC